jgi:hypothetical protein
MMKAYTLINDCSDIKMPNVLFVEIGTRIVAHLIDWGIVKHDPEAAVHLYLHGISLITDNSPTYRKKTYWRSSHSMRRMMGYLGSSRTHGAVVLRVHQRYIWHERMFNTG